MNRLMMVLVVCLATAGDGPTASASSGLSDADWPAIRATREEALQQYLKSEAVGYDWFANAMHGEEAGTPFLLMRSFPDLAPDIWGAPEERLARFGFIDDPKDPNRPLPLGLGWRSNPGKGDGELAVDHTVTLTCAACHVGKVRVATGLDLLLVGAPNTQIDVRKFRRAVELTAERMMSAEAQIKDTTARLVKIVASKPEGYFYGGRYGIDAQAETRERERYKDPAYVAKMLVGFGQKVQIGRYAVVKELATSYSKANAPPLDGGSPGQSDGTGDLLPKFLLGKVIDRNDVAGSLKRFLTNAYPELPYRNATATDNLSVFMQTERRYGQLDGSLKESIIRNVAAMTAVVGSPVGSNLMNAELTGTFTARLPAPPYPFAVDMPRARRGAAIFAANCAACHSAGNENIYKLSEIGTDPNRAQVLSPEGKKLLLDNFKAAFLLKDKNFIAKRADGTTFKPTELTDDEIINDRTRLDRQGYSAIPLDGIWARAPYLHNGSVPTLRHLLAPGNPESSRPSAFVRGVIRYDTLNVGFAWDARDAAALATEAPTAIMFDTGWDGASNSGHCQEIRVKDDGTVDASGSPRRLDWSGPDRRTELEDLLEYLKTL